ncbi:hypothetical protein KIW84_020702 [Lathyrus oleraceus]|uniref:Retrovirus-related Pol polyprotein from transposon TNT 1-94-like beta-barrel domain-containing protein n=1 Tax=Pisum sativum TaxID=3888 RepID=A0A9D4Y5R5_PEA|nr:hypothetical protein KIW84_020702 [Pisum sativum]
MEQIDKLYKFLESPTPSYYIATKGNYTFLNVNPIHTWIVDSGASDHMIDESTLFSSYSPCAGNEKIKIADGFFSAIDLNLGKMIVRAKESGELYYLDIGSSSQLPSKTISSCFESFAVLNMLDEILENGEKKAMGFDYSSMNNNVKVSTKKFVTTEKKIEFLMKDNMSQHPIQHVHLIILDTRNLLRDVIIVVDMVA